MNEPYKKTINNLIAADDLHWEEEEQNRDKILDVVQVDGVFYYLLDKTIYRKP